MAPFTFAVPAINNGTAYAKVSYANGTSVRTAIITLCGINCAE